MASVRSRSRSPDDPNSESLMQPDEVKSDDPDEISISTIRSPKELFKWFMKDPFSRWQLVFFLLMFVLSIVLIVVAIISPDSSYTTGGIAGLIVAAYGAFHFKTLMALREEVDVFERHNNEFKQENAKVRVELDKLEKTKEELETARLSLNETTKKNKENLEKFQTISNNLELMGEQSIAGLSKVTEMTRGIASKWKEELIEQERQLYLDVFEQLELKDDDEEMTKSEYDEFLDTLPPKYRMRITQNYSFDKLAGENGTLSFKEFSDLLDKLAQEFATTGKVGSSSSPVSPNAGNMRSSAGNNIEEEE